mmetsp:Transcript_104967/g.296968  ORF Transcript_104967/g.296968 Transcript_104967/m.296968 type:complete len:221 (+) Transcript_104967:314-976(+)
MSSRTSTQRCGCPSCSGRSATGSMACAAVHTTATLKGLHAMDDPRRRETPSKVAQTSCAFSRKHAATSRGARPLLSRASRRSSPCMRTHWSPHCISSFSRTRASGRANTSMVAAPGGISGRSLVASCLLWSWNSTRPDFGDIFASQPTGRGITFRSIVISLHIVSTLLCSLLSSSRTPRRCSRTISGSKARDCWTCQSRSSGCEWSFAFSLPTLMTAQGS